MGDLWIFVVAVCLFLVFLQKPQSGMTSTPENMTLSMKVKCKTCHRRLKSKNIGRCVMADCPQGGAVDDKVVDITQAKQVKSSHKPLAPAVLDFTKYNGYPDMKVIENFKVPKKEPAATVADAYEYPWPLQ